MIERLETGRRMSKIAKYNDVANLCGQVGAGKAAEEQTRDCLSRIEHFCPRSTPAPTACCRPSTGLRI